MSILTDSKRLVIKIGSALLVDSQNPTVRQEWLESVCHDIAQLRSQGKEVIVVSSGAISLARRQMGLANGRLKIEEKQALASIGQVSLAEAWHNALQKYDLTSALMLLTSEDTENRQRHINARNTLESILTFNAIPIINENDAITVDEIRFGDNDRLAARIAQMIDADTLILLSDIDGLYTGDPRKSPDAHHIPSVPFLTEEIMELGGDAPPGHSSGGMRTKLLAGRIATHAGTRMFISDGRTSHPIKRLQEGDRHTVFLPHEASGQARKRWIGGMLATNGSVTLDSGAMHALINGASLLPAGATHIDGTFDAGEAISLLSPTGKVLGHGLAEYSAKDMLHLLGHQSEETEELIGHHGRDVLIHRDNLTLHPTSSADESDGTLNSDI